ncbi:hypothetical protein H310_01300 [Aphanomyces invadans]|uniref:VTT domain-containing protein n=1 Tax=Aphanomyces invadans TaxID=157072 RepID=A0A024URH7_9STRA|nr:hypothetical protein H310_01300 [Aphanomyces invadans]ETW08785.1 hypothetical protein H310_01300 [Aphanomyces invadans]RHY33682.1 hypothetical protein DYB32_003529 [Aphanomyces invadans]|eukprot:XP_008862590.1 hypothetical protein H310_01300 [Aphanomyces invadans]
MRQRVPAANEPSARNDECKDNGKKAIVVAPDVVSLVVIFVMSLVSVATAIYYLILHDLDPEDAAKIRFPTSLHVAKELGQELRDITAHSPGRVLVAHGLLYLFLQSWAIPGTVFVNLLGGALFGLLAGFPLCLFYNTLGSCFMYGLSSRFGGKLVQKYLSTRLQQMRGMIDAHRDDLTLYMIFLRIFPFSPNWFMNMSSPHVNIPLLQFAMSVAIGLTPYNFLSCKAGLILSALQSKGDIIDTATTVQLIVVAVGGLVGLPRLKARFAK